MFSGGDYEEVRRWLANFALAHAKRENPRIEARIEAEGPYEGKQYGVRLRLGDRMAPPAGTTPLVLDYPDVRDHRGSLTWGLALAARVRELARPLCAGQPAAAAASRPA
jgi:hypothetical protein